MLCDDKRHVGNVDDGDGEWERTKFLCVRPAIRTDTRQLRDHVNGCKFTPGRIHSHNFSMFTRRQGVRVDCFVHRVASKTIQRSAISDVLHVDDPAQWHRFMG